MPIERATSAAHRWSGLAARGLWLGSCALLVTACGSDDEDADDPVGPTGEVALEVTGFVNQQDQHFAADSTSVTLSCDGSLGVAFGPLEDGGLQNWLLRPPGACGSAPQCGYISLEVVEASTGVGSTQTGAATTLYLTATPGLSRLEATLMNGAGEAFLQGGEPVLDQIDELVLLAPEGCDATSTGMGGSGSSATTNTGGGTTSVGGTSSGATSSGSGGGGEAGSSAAGQGGQAGAAQG